MATARQLFWRSVGPSEFACVERARENTPSSGGGQTYFSVIFGEHLDKEELGRFLGLEPADRLITERPPVPLSAGVLGDPSSRPETIEFRPRYRDPTDERDRYYIARQSRQRARQSRHPAWRGERGFPEAPDDVADGEDSRMPDLSHLKLIIARDHSGGYHADYVNTDHVPTGTPPPLRVLYEPNEIAGPDGLIDLGDLGVSLDALATLLHPRDLRSRSVSPEVEDAREATSRVARAHRHGQGFRQSNAEREAIDAHAMALAHEHLESDGWEVEDRSANHPYDLFCQRNGEQLHVEVKGTTSEGSAVLLTPNEVEFARGAFPEIALLVVREVQLLVDEHGGPVAAGGETSLLVPWDIDVAGTLKPTGFAYELSD